MTRSKAREAIMLQYRDIIASKFPDYILHEPPYSKGNRVQITCARCGDKLSRTVRWLIDSDLDSPSIGCPNCKNYVEINAPLLRGMEVLNELTASDKIVICNAINSNVSSLSDLARLFKIQETVLLHIQATNKVVTTQTLIPIN